MPTPWKLTTDQKAEVVERHAAGQSQQHIATHFGVDSSAIRGILRRRRAGLVRSQLSETQELKAAGRYPAGESSVTIAASLGISPKAVVRALRRRGVVIGDRPGNRLPLRHEAFDMLTPEAAYWIGFLFADGSVARGSEKTPAVSVGLSECDRDHLVKLRAFLGSTHAITSIRGNTFRGYMCKPTCHFKVTSSRLAARLLDLGRYEGSISAEIAASRDFWRGMTDGDGSIGIYGTHARFSLVGQRRMLETFNSFLVAAALPSRPIRPCRSIFAVSAECGPAEQIVDLLYRDAAVTLDRKAVTAREIMASFGPGH